MISKKMEKLVAGSSVIRAMFEEGKQMAAKVGAENVYDFSLGNPNVPAPAEVNEALSDIVKNTDRVYFFTDTISHSTYYRYMNVIREHGVDFGYIHGVNIEKNIRDIYRDVNDY